MSGESAVGSKPQARGRGARLPASQMADMIALGRLRFISGRAIEQLFATVQNKHEETKHRVAATRCIVAHHQWREDYERPMQPEAAFFSLMGGTAQAAAWLATNYDRLRLLAAGPASHDEPVSLEGVPDVSPQVP